jgi:hypothetical protein
MRTNSARFIALCLAGTAIASCRPTGVPRPSVASWSFAQFDFTFRNGSRAVAGTLEVRNGVMEAKPSDGRCFIDRTTPEREDRTVFRCSITAEFEDLTLTFDNRDPEARSWWRATVYTMVNRLECTAYMTDERGQRVCTATHNVNEERKGSIGGAITLKARVTGN